MQFYVVSQCFLIFLNEKIYLPSQTFTVDRKIKFEIVPTNSCSESSYVLDTLKLRTIKEQHSSSIHLINNNYILKLSLIL